ncbi:VIT domain-containing protein [Nostoc sp. 2RC]|uniref:VIT domain-containing protein n=1 Tax=Nostoc sp. 2RC TaxID=2485484 RepID=UPI001627336F|nr:VIT domain-containing protein [Nostoc sp. 2RC]MBC1241332.1 after-VIT domain-containing protein [Nostoc sp. 2RC]
MNTGSANNQQLGGLYVQSPEGQQLVFPLKHTEVLAKVAGNLSRVEVIQSFENPFTQPLEAVYIFPLPDEAAVDDMEIKIGDRIIKGNIKKREEAQQIYEKAKQQGRTAGLLEQERDNIFTQSLANIKPGEQIDVTIRYTESLKFEAGNYEFVFPMVVGPRYIPGTTIDNSGDTDRVPDASRITPPVVPEGMRSRHDINVIVEIDAGLPISQVRSPSHQLKIEHAGQIVRIQLAGEDTIPNKDLILRYQVSGQETQSTVITQADHRGGHFAIYLIPALEYSTDEIVPKDVVFLVDTSGSQSGDPLKKCQELMRRFINGLNPNDTFTILDFSDKVRQLSKKPLPNTAENRAKAIAYINNLQAAGGTEMLSGIRTAIKFPTPAGRLRSVVLLTDGYIGNENEILAEVQKHLQVGNRLYSFGAGSSVNRFLLNRIAEIGRGISRIIRHDEPTEEVAEKFYKQINNPVLTNIQISWEGSKEPPVIYPKIAPDLFCEQPLVLFARKQDKASGNLQISGIAVGGKRYEKTFHLTFEETENLAVAQLWGRACIKDLMNQMVSYETKAGVEAVTQTALTYQLLSQYTAFVAVSDDVRVEPKSQYVSMQVPVEMPEAVSYEGVFASPPAGAVARQITFPMAAAPASADEVPDFLEQRRWTKREESAPPSPKLAASIPHQLEVLSATGLDETAIADLTQHLKKINLPPGFGGEIVFEFAIKKGRVTGIMLDEQASTQKDAAVVENIKRSLLLWIVPTLTTAKVVLTLRIHA